MKVTFEGTPEEILQVIAGIVTLEEAEETDADEQDAEGDIELSPEDKFKIKCANVVANALAPELDKVKLAP